MQFNNIAVVPASAECGQAPLLVSLPELWQSCCAKCFASQFDDGRCRVPRYPDVPSRKYLPGCLIRGLTSCSQCGLMAFCSSCWVSDRWHHEATGFSKGPPRGTVHVAADQECQVLGNLRPGGTKRCCLYTSFGPSVGVAAEAQGVQSTCPSHSQGGPVAGAGMLRAPSRPTTSTCSWKLCCRQRAFVQVPCVRNGPSS